MLVLTPAAGRRRVRRLQQRRVPVGARGCRQKLRPRLLHAREQVLPDQVQPARGDGLLLSGETRLASQPPSPTDLAAWQLSQIT